MDHKIQKAKTVSVSKPLLKLKLLDCLRQSNFQQLCHLIANEFQPFNEPTVRSVFELILHYAVQVSPASLIKDIVQNWTTKGSSNSELFIDINKQDQDGNTPLHLAAFQSRGDVVTLLMNHPDINDCILNDAHLQPIEMCKNLNIAQMMQVARANYVAEIAQEFRQAFNNRDIDHLNSILSNPRNQELLDINGMEPETGDTVLHEFVKKRDILLCRWILDHGGDPFKRDSRGKLPIDLLKKVSSKEQNDKKNAIDLELKKMLEKAAREQSVIDVTNNLHEPPTYKGYLRKWTNFAQGYKLRWFILSSDGIFSYYKDQADTSNACRGSLNMSTCYLHLDSSEKLKFEIIGGSNGTIRWHLKGNHPIETNKWVWAIQSAIRFAKDREIMTKNGHAVSSTHGSGSSGSQDKSLENKPPSSMPSLHSYDNRQQQPPHRRTTSSASSVSSAELVELNSNLTESGKDFVSKVRNSRNSNLSVSPLSSIADDQTASFSSDKDNKVDTLRNKSGSAQSESGKGFRANQSINGEDVEDDAEEDEDDDEDDQDMLETLGEDDDEDVKMVYGPHAQEITILQRAISIELSSLIELINENNPSEEHLKTARKSLGFITKNFSELNQMSQTRDKKLIKMLSKQRDINNLWIKSVKDLELELLEKGEKLVSLDIERKNLKKLLQKKLSEVNTADFSLDNKTVGDKGNDSAKPLQEIVEFIENHESDEDIDSEVDEFFDAEDIDNEEASVASVEAPTGGNQMASTPDKENEVSSPSLQGDSNETLEKSQEMPSATKSTVPEIVISPEGSSLDKGTTRESVETELPLAVTAEQKGKAKVLLEEGSFLGYEDKLRQRLKLGKDDRPSVSLWSVLKSMVGKDMTRMTLPVSFNEPTSLLQRVAEDLEYADLLNQAASFEDSTLRLLYVAIFTVSSYASTVKRVAKPFNPLLGETFEYSRPDKSYRFFTEQVSHHPPISATWTESPKWDFFGESFVDSKFNGRSFDFKHLGLWYLTIRPDSNGKEELYTYKKPNNQVVGILLGNPQVDNYGDVKIVNHNTGDYCMIHFKARGWRSSSAYEVKGEVYNAKGGKEWIFGGRWNESVSAKKVLKPNSLEEMQVDELKHSVTHTSNGNSVGPKYDGSRFNVWHVNERPEFPFNLTKFAVTLNAPQPHLLPWLPPTDTRLRPDQRAMEEGRYDEAATEKHRVEERQRSVRKKREEKNITYQQRWFKKEIHPVTKCDYWKFNGEYWRQRRDHKLANEGDIF